MALIFEDQHFGVMMCINDVNLGCEFLTDAIINADTTVDELAADVQLLTTGDALYEDLTWFKNVRYPGAVFTLEALGILTDTNVNAITTGIPGLQALFTAGDAQITDPTIYGNRSFGE
jgi:hypothetical protein